MNRAGPAIRREPRFIRGHDQGDRTVAGHDGKGTPDYRPVPGQQQYVPAETAHHHVEAARVERTSNARDAFVITGHAGPVTVSSPPLTQDVCLSAAIAIRRPPHPRAD